MVNRENEQMLWELPVLWSAGDVDAIAERFTEDCRYEDATLGWVHEGRAAVREFAANVFGLMPDFHIEYSSAFATDCWGAAEWLITATFCGELEGVRVQNKPVAFRGATVFELREGLIRRNTDYWDYQVWLRQLGVLSLLPK